MTLDQQVRAHWQGASRLARAYAKRNQHQRMLTDLESAEADILSSWALDGAPDPDSAAGHQSIRNAVMAIRQDNANVGAGVTRQTASLESPDCFDARAGLVRVYANLDALPCPAKRSGHSDLWDKIPAHLVDLARQLSDGRSYTEVCAELGCARKTVVKRKAELALFCNQYLRAKWAEVIARLLACAEDAVDADHRPLGCIKAAVESERLDSVRRRWCDKPQPTVWLDSFLADCVRDAVQPTRRSRRMAAYRQYLYALRRLA